MEVSGTAFRSYLLEDTATAISSALSQKGSREKHAGPLPFSILGQLPVNSTSHLVKATGNQTGDTKGDEAQAGKQGGEGEAWIKNDEWVKQRETTQHIDVKTTETTFLHLGAFFSVVLFFFLWIAPFWCCYDMHIVKYWGEVNEGTLDIHLVVYKACTLKRYQQVWHNIYKLLCSPCRTSGSLQNELCHRWKVPWAEPNKSETSRQLKLEDLLSIDARESNPLDKLFQEELILVKIYYPDRNTKAIIQGSYWLCKCRVTKVKYTGRLKVKKEIGDQIKHLERGKYSPQICHSYL